MSPEEHQLLQSHQSGGHNERHSFRREGEYFRCLSGVRIFPRWYPHMSVVPGWSPPPFFSSLLLSEVENLK